MSKIEELRQIIRDLNSNITTLKKEVARLSTPDYFEQMVNDGWRTDPETGKVFNIND